MPNPDLWKCQILSNYQWRWEICFPARAITSPACDQTDVRQTSFPVPFLTPECLPCLPLARQKTLVNPILRPLNPKPQTPQEADQHKSLPKSLKPAAPPPPFPGASHTAKKNRGPQSIQGEGVSPIPISPNFFDIALRAAAFCIEAAHASEITPKNTNMVFFEKPRFCTVKPRKHRQTQCFRPASHLQNKTRKKGTRDHRKYHACHGFHKTTSETCTFFWTKTTFEIVLPPRPNAYLQKSARRLTPRAVFYELKTSFIQDATDSAL